MVLCNWMTYTNFIYLFQYKNVKTCFKYFPPISRNASKTFVCLCRRTVSLIHTIFNTVHDVLNTNDTFKFQDIWRKFTRVRACTDRRTDKQTECILQLCWKVLKKAEVIFLQQSKRVMKCLSYTIYSFKTL